MPAIGPPRRQAQRLRLNFDSVSGPCCCCCRCCLCRVVLFLAGADSSACMVGLDKGEAVGRPMRPKNASTPLSMALLDASGIPLPLLHGQLVLAWANNNSTATPRTLAMTKVASLKEGGGGGVGGEAASRLPRLRWVGGWAAASGLGASRD